MFDRLFLESQKAGTNLALPFLYDINSQFHNQLKDRIQTQLQLQNQLQCLLISIT